MAIGNILRGLFNGVKEIGSHIPVANQIIKQGEDTLGQIGNVGDNLLTTKDNQPATYNTQADNVQQGQSGDQNIGNLVGRPQAAATNPDAATTMTSAANAAKQAAAADEAASEIALML
jgi:hypothetical protein